MTLNRVSMVGFFADPSPLSGSRRGGGFLSFWAVVILRAERIQWPDLHPAQQFQGHCLIPDAEPALPVLGRLAARHPRHQLDADDVHGLAPDLADLGVFEALQQVLAVRAEQPGLQPAPLRGGRGQHQVTPDADPQRWVRSGYAVASTADAIDDGLHCAFIQRLGAGFVNQMPRRYAETFTI